MEREKTRMQLREQEKRLTDSIRCHTKTYEEMIYTKNAIEHLAERIPDLEKEIREAQERLPELQKRLETLRVTLPSDKKRREKLKKMVELLRKKLNIERQLQTVT